MNKKEALKKVSTAKTLAELKAIVENTKELTGLPVVAVKTETIKENIVKVLNGAITIEELKQAKVDLLKKAREQAAKGSAKDQPETPVLKEDRGKEKSKNEKEVKDVKKEVKNLLAQLKGIGKDKKGLILFVETFDLMSAKEMKEMKEMKAKAMIQKIEASINNLKGDHWLAKKEKEVKKEVEPENKAGKKVAKLLDQIETIKNDKDQLKAFKKENDLNVQTKGLKAKEVYKAILLLLSGNTTKQTTKGRTIAEVRPMVETIAKVEGKKAFVVSRPETVRGFISQLLLTAKKEQEPISFEDLYKEVCKFQKIGKEDRKKMFSEKSGLYTTCRVTPTNIGQTDFHVTITGSGENRTFIAS